MAKAKHPTFHRTSPDLGRNTHEDTRVGIIHMPRCPFMHSWDVSRWQILDERQTHRPDASRRFCGFLKEGKRILQCFSRIDSNPDPIGALFEDRLMWRELELFSAKGVQARKGWSEMQGLRAYFLTPGFPCSAIGIPPGCGSLLGSCCSSSGGMR
jgi:hypothetical protein